MRLAWTKAALSHLDEIQDYVAQDSPSAAYRLANELARRVSILSDVPMAGRLGRARGTRELVLSDLAYIVVYRVSDQIEILAIVHTARQWPERFD